MYSHEDDENKVSHYYKICKKAKSGTRRGKRRLKKFKHAVQIKNEIALQLKPCDGKTIHNPLSCAEYAQQIHSSFLKKEDERIFKAFKVRSLVQTITRDLNSLDLSNEESSQKFYQRPFPIKQNHREMLVGFLHGVTIS